MKMIFIKIPNLRKQYDRYAAKTWNQTVGVLKHFISLNLNRIKSGFAGDPGFLDLRLQ